MFIGFSVWGFGLRFGLVYFWIHASSVCGKGNLCIAPFLVGGFPALCPPGFTLVTLDLLPCSTICPFSARALGMCRQAEISRCSRDTSKLETELIE